MKMKQVIHPTIEEIRNQIPPRFMDDDKNTVEALTDLVDDWRNKFYELEALEARYQTLERSVREDIGLLAEFLNEPVSTPVPELIEEAINKLNARAVKVDELEGNLEATRKELRDVQVHLFETLNPNAPLDSATGDVRRLALEVSRYAGGLEETIAQNDRELDLLRRNLSEAISKYQDEHRKRTVLEGREPKLPPEKTLQAVVRESIKMIRDFYSSECYFQSNDGAQVAEAIIDIAKCVEKIAARLKM